MARRRSGRAAQQRPRPGPRRKDAVSKIKPTGIEIRKRDGGTVYRAVVHDKATGKRISKTFPTISAAKSWRQDAYAALRAGTLSADRGPTLAAMSLTGWRMRGRGHARNRSGDPYKPAAIRGYEKELRLRVLPEYGSVRVGDLRRSHMQRLVDRLVKQDHSASTVQCVVTALRAVFRYARRRDMLNDDPTHKLELPAVRSKPRRFCSSVEAAELIAALPVADRALWATAFYAGLRRGELTGLRWEDVDLVANEIRVERGWDAVEGDIASKSRQGHRKVPLPAILHAFLWDHRVANDDPRVFGSPRAIRSSIEAATKDLGLNVRVRPCEGSARRALRRVGLRVLAVRWPGAGDAARGAPYVRVADDRRRGERKGALGVHGAREHRRDDRPLRPPDAGLGG